MYLCMDKSTTCAAKENIQALAPRDDDDDG